MFRHRNLLFTWVVVLSIMMATACGPAATPTPAEEPAQAPATEAPTEAAATEEAPATEAPAFAPGTTLTYIASQNWVLDSEMELAKQFEAETGVHVDFQIIPSDQYFNVL